MAEGASEQGGPDLARGVDIAKLEEGAPLLGHVGDEQVMLVRRGEEFFAIGATCTHYGGPLAEGLVVGDTVRCPWHHACFSLRTGEPERPPALDPVSCFKVEREGQKVRVGGKQEPQAKQASAGTVKKIVIVGGGAAGNMAAETLRHEGFQGSITMLSADAAVPCDRPNLSKDYLAGNAQEDWIPLRPTEFYDEKKIELRLGARVVAIHTEEREIELADGSRVAYDALLLATGATPVPLDVPGADLPHVHYLRTLADSNALIEAAKGKKRAVVIGASFIGLEVSASLRQRKLEVTVVAPEEVPLERVMGKEVGGLVRSIHEEKGVSFGPGAKVKSIDAKAVHLESGETLPADLVVVGIGVKPALELAEKAGLKIEKGVAVDEHLETSVPGIFAAGDIARWPDPHTGERIRVEHWVLAERQGQTAARNMMGTEEKFEAVPFFWSQHYDTSILYVGHAESVGRDEDRGRPREEGLPRDLQAGRATLAVVTIGRDMESLKAEVELEGTSRQASVGSGREHVLDHDVNAASLSSIDDRVRMRQWRAGEVERLQGGEALERLHAAHRRAGEVERLQGGEALERLHAAHLRAGEVERLQGGEALERLHAAHLRAGEVEPLQGGEALERLDAAHLRAGEVEPSAGR